MLSCRKLSTTFGSQKRSIMSGNRDRRFLFSLIAVPDTPHVFGAVGCRWVFYMSYEILSQSMVVSSEGSGMIKTGFRVRSSTEPATFPRKVCLKTPFP